MAWVYVCYYFLLLPPPPPYSCSLSLSLTHLRIFLLACVLSCLHLFFYFSIIFLLTHLFSFILIAYPLISSSNAQFILFLPYLPYTGSTKYTVG